VNTTHRLAWAIAFGIGVVTAPGVVGTVHGQSAATTTNSGGQPSAFTIDGEASVWVVAIRPDKTQDFEQVMTRLREALHKSQKPERQRQASGWRVLRVGKPMPDGNIAYVHVINPVVPAADYTVLQILYDEFPEERQALYELYRGAFVQSLSLVAGSVAVDLTKTE
jgi:hypothetical protein